jgi:predicted transcriptional regulator
VAEIKPTIMKITDKMDIAKVKFAAKKLRILSHYDRYEIIQLIIQQPGLNVTQIQNRIGLPQADTSGHLLLMKKFGILNSTRQGKSKIYSVNEKVFDHIEKVVKSLNN